MAGDNIKKISIIVPVYNMTAGGKLRFCLDSLVNQTLPHTEYEIIAVDDCSTDDSLSVLRDYAARFPELFVVLQTPENLRQGGAKNLGLAHARGEWIGFVDSDDFVALDFYEKLLALAVRENADMAGCDLWRTRQQSFEDGYERVAGCINDTAQSGGSAGASDAYGAEGDDARLSGTEQAEALRRRLILDGGFIPPKIFKRNIVFGSGEPVFPEKMFYEDNAAGSVWMTRVRRFAYLPEPLYYYYQGEASTTHMVTRERLADRRKAARVMLADAKAERVTADDEGGSISAYERYRPEFEYRFTQLFYVNTLFSAMQAKGLAGCYAFTKALAREMKESIPDFQENPYYKARTAPEEQKLIAMQMRSHLRFYVYYRALWAYRGLWKGKQRA